MTALERLLLEAIPTGHLFGRPQPAPAPRPAAPGRDWPPDPDAARHRAELAAALRTHTRAA